MIRERCEELLQQLNAKLQKLEEEDLNPIEAFKSAVPVINNSMLDLKSLIVEIGFSSEKEEIEFFKVVKPQFYSLLVYAVERFNFENDKPLLEEELSKYYLEHFVFISKFFRQNEFLYQYYRFDASELDTLYFTRGQKPVGILLSDMPELDSSFATAGDYLFAKFMAYEKLQSYIHQLINKPLRGTDELQKKVSPLTWTGDKTNLVEIIYGLFYTGQLNNGNASVSDIIKWMEQNLQIDLSRSYRNFVDIRNRKRDSPTRFLDKMRDFILQRIDEDNAFKPNRGIKLLGDNR